MFTLPAAARVSCWLNAWLAGRVSADAAISGLVENDHAEFVGPEPGTRRSPALFLGELRRWGAQRASSALPVPGDPLGLGGPPEFNIEVIAAFEGVVLHGAGYGLVLKRTGLVTSWVLAPATPPTYLPQVADADRSLRAAMATAADALAALDVAAWQRDAADALVELRRPTSVVESIPFATPQCARLAADARRAAGIVALARSGDGGALSVWDAERRASALQPLDRAARAATVAASSSYDGG